MRLTAGWAVLALSSPQRPEMCAEEMKRALETATAGVGSVSQNASNAFDALEARSAARLRALGADNVPAKVKPEKVARSEFSISRNTAAKQAEAEEMLRVMRQKDAGELEGTHTEEIRLARSMAKQWLDAGLPKRAEEELLKVQPYVSLKTDIGATFHLELASILVQLGGRVNEVKRLRTRVMQEASSSSLRWQAQRLLESSDGTFQRSDTGPANEELSKLFKMPEW
ncbi:MAG: hypothetical protein SGPRY_008315 [Prymnesium sp.]